MGFLRITGRSLIGFATRAGVLSVLGVLVIATGGRVLGFVREVLISSQYGTSATADAFFTVQQVPVMVSAFVFGPFMIAYVPYYAALRASGVEGRALRRTLRTAMTAGLATTGVMILSGLLLLEFDVGPSVGGQRLIGAFSLILASSIVPLLVTGLASVVLHARGQHVAAMAIAALTPAGMLVALLLLTVVPLVGHSDALPWSFVAGALISAGVGVVALRRILPPPSGAATATVQPHPGAGKFRRELLASALENVGFSVNQALTVFLAAGLGGGAVATNAYAFRVAAFAFSAVSPLNISAQTWMTRDRSHREGRRVLSLVGAMAALVVGIAVALILVAGPLVAFVYLRGSFSDVDAANVSALLTPYAVYGVVTALNQLMARYLFVHLQGALYSRVMIGAYVAGNVLKAAMVGPFGLEGVIWASVLAEGAALAYFIVYLLRRGRSSASGIHAPAD
jgi:putative peptidoglycan lipid II flippase